MIQLKRLGFDVGIINLCFVLGFNELTNKALKLIILKQFPLLYILQIERLVVKIQLYCGFLFFAHWAL